MLIIFDKYTENVVKMRQTALHLGIDLAILCLNDNGFLPNWVLTPYRLLSPIQASNELTEKGFFLNSLEVPAFWEIRPEANSQGAIYDMGCKKASIFFTEPQENKYIEHIEWLMDSGWVYKIDHYDKYGQNFVSEFLDKKGNLESQVFYTPDRKEQIIVQPQNDVVSVFENGSLKAYFTSYPQFIAYCLERAGFAKSCAIFVQNEEQLPFISLMRQEQIAWKYILFESLDLKKKYQGPGPENGYLFHAIPASYPPNHGNKDILILTASDQMEGLENLAKALPDMTFHIAANTQVSETLRQFSEQHKNITLYPQISPEALNVLWDTCDFYLDINYYREIYHAIDTAHQKNLLILGFENTLHHKELVTDECVFPAPDYDNLAMTIKQCADNPALMQNLLEKQQSDVRDIWIAVQHGGIKHGNIRI